MKFYTFQIPSSFVLKMMFLLLAFTQVQFTNANEIIQSQNGVISGKITTENGEPISLVSVMLRGTSFGSSTDDNGVFSFDAPAGNYTLIVSSVGFKRSTQKVILVARESIEADFTLQESSEELDEVVVNGLNKDEQLILESKTATKSNMSLMNTPAPIVVVGKGVLNQQANITLQEAIRNVSGLTQAGNNFGIGDNLIIRGLGANYAYDGMYGGGGLDNNFNPTRTLTNIERIEVLKGPATGLYGIGSAGGVINMIEKKPLDVEQISLEFQLGRWNSFRTMLDATAPLSEKTSYRIVGAIGASDGYRDLSNERSELYTSLRHNVSEKSEFILSAAYINDENQIDAIGDPVRILNEASLINPALGYTADNLINDFDADEDGVFGQQLTDAQRQVLANSIADGDGLTPYDLGDGTLISPLSQPNKGKEFRLKLRHDWSLSEKTTLTQQFQYRSYSSDFTRQTGAFNYVYWNRNGEINALPRAPLVIDDVIYPFAARRQEYRSQQAKEKAFQYFADLQSLWKTGSFRGEHLVSVNYERRNADVISRSIYDADGTTSDNPVPYILDIRSPNWPTANFDDYDPIVRSNYAKDLQSYGVSLQEVVYFNKFTGRFGGAYSTITQLYENKGTSSNEATPEADTDDSGFSYNLGLNYRVIDQLSAFVNYSKGRTAFSVLGSLTGDDDRPDSESFSFDVGLRFTAFDNKMTGSLVYFKTGRTNLRYTNPLFNDNEGDIDFNIDVPQYFFDDEDQSEGVEFDINMVFDRHLSLSANATYQDAVSIRSNEVSEQSKGVPQKYARMWGEYKFYLRNAKRPLRFNLGIRYESERTVNSSGFGLPDAFLPSYVVWDTGVSFDFRKWNVRLNMDNLFNEKYYSNAMFLGGLPGQPTNAQLTMRYTF